MVQDQWLQQKIKFLIGYYLKIVIQWGKYGGGGGGVCVCVCVCVCGGGGGGGGGEAGGSLLGGILANEGDFPP